MNMNIEKNWHAPCNHFLNFIRTPITLPITTSHHVEFEEKGHSQERNAIYNDKFRSSCKITERKTDFWIERPQFLYERNSKILKLGASCFRRVIKDT